MNQDLIDLSSQHPWVLDFYRDLTTFDDMANLRKYYITIDDLQRQNLNLLNVFIKYVDTKSSPILVMIAILRLTYTVGHTLPAWKLYLQNCTDELNKRGENPSSLLRGLYHPYFDHFNVHL